MPESHRNYRLAADGLPDAARAVLRDASRWPRYLRYAACAVTRGAAASPRVPSFRALCVRPCVFASLKNMFGLQLCDRSDMTRDEKRGLVLAAPGLSGSWELGSWDAGRPCVHKRRPSLSQRPEGGAAQQRAARWKEQTHGCRERPSGMGLRPT